MASAAPLVHVARDGAVLTVELHRPQALNALTVGLVDALCAALDEAADPAVRAVVLTGAGRAFSSGADLKDTGGPQLASGAPDFARGLRETFNLPVRRLRALGKPVIAAVNGPAVGIAVSYALACDLVVAARSAYLLLSFTNVGLVPDGGASALISARAGVSRFAELALLAERLEPERALAWGLVDRVVDDGEALAAATALAQRLAAGPTSAYAAVKRMVDAGPLRGLEDALELEAELQGTRGEHPDLVEGVAAFLQKRPPAFA